MQRRFLLVLVVPSAFALSGCVAAAIPVLAGSAVAGSAARDRTSAPDVAPRQVDPPTPVGAAAIPSPPSPLPSDGAELRPGQLYTGTLPPPGPSAAPAAPVSAQRELQTWSWSDVGRHVAANLSPEPSVLLARGADAANPRWVPCGEKPRAVLAMAATVLATGGSPRALDETAQSWLEALRVLEVKAVLIASDPAEAAAVATAFGKAGLPRLVEGDTLIVASAPGQMPAIRAGVGARYCVAALAGRSAADFPNGLTPATTPASLRSSWGKGWFLIGGPAR